MSALAFRTADRNHHLSRETFTYYRCPRCSLIFLDPVPDHLDDYYPPAYYGDPPALEDLVGAAAHLEGYKIELVRRFARGGRLVDVGPGLGGFAYLAKQAGFAVEAVEMDAACCEYLSSVLAIRAFHSADVPGILSAQGPYDVISLWHVIEHLANPWAVLEAAAAALRAGGIVVLAAPNPRALQFMLLRGRWAHVDAPRHLQLIPCSLVERRAERLGLDVLLRTTTDEGGVAWNLFGWRQSLANLSTTASVRTALERLGSLLNLVVGPLERRAMNGSAYTLVLRRPATA